MEILYQLPFPDDVCSKIFIYACKSPHTGIGVAILKKIIGLSIYNKLIEYEKHDINVVNMSNFELTFDIIHLKSLTNLTKIYLSNTGVNGDIEHLKSLMNLTYIGLGDTGVNGNIAHLKSLLNLTKIWLKDTGVSGNIEHIKSLPKLTVISIENTDVYGDKEAFRNYRKSARLPYCRIIF
jgi:hypothetical protein